MDFLQASIDAALRDSLRNTSTKEDSPEDLDYDDGYGFNIDEFNFAGSSCENGDDSNVSDNDEQPPVLEETIIDDKTITSIKQVLNKDDNGPPTISRAYHEDILPLDKCTMNGNRLSIDGCKYTFVRLNVRNNVYFRCVNCYGIYQKRRSLVTKSGAHVEVPSVGSLKLISAETGEIRGNPDRPSGIPHCCENEKFKENIKIETTTPTRKNIDSPIDPLSFFNNISTGNGININGINHSGSNTRPGADDDMIVPLEKCKFTDKKLEIEGCKYVFSRTQSGPRDYYRCSACIALYHKRHFRKLPTPKIGSLSLIREIGVLTGNPEEPRGLPHICDNLELHCPPIRADYRTKVPTQQTTLPSSPIRSILEAARTWSNTTPKITTNGNSTNGILNKITNGLQKSDSPKQDQNKPMSVFQKEIIKRSLTDLNGPQNKIRKMVEDAMGPVQSVPKLVLKTDNSKISPPIVTSNGTTNKKENSDDIESTYPHTNDLLIPPKRSLPDHDLSHTKRSSSLATCYAQFPKLPNQGRILIFADTLLTEFESKTLTPSTSIVRAEFPVTPMHVVNLCTKAKYNMDCFSKTKYVFFVLGYDIMRCMDLNSLERRVNTIENDFLEMRQFLDEETSDRNVVLIFVTIPEMGVLTQDLKALNNSMRKLISNIGRDDLQICDWAQEYSLNPIKMANIEDRLSILMKKMTKICGTELLDED
uniref:Uncharacterized protein n=1 Tax=Panagrolaimus sp. JU765 TaxID=591449 RepID=A0AC34Q8N1_9BILA